jgi:hypothetical protein
MHAAASHTKLPQGRLAGVMQAPLPSQVDAGVTEETLAQMADLQFALQ